MNARRLAVLAFLCAAAFAGCGGGGGSSAPSIPAPRRATPTPAPPRTPTPKPTPSPTPTPTPVPSTTPLPGQGKIKHIVIVIQENRSFDYLFHGFPGADAASSGRISTGQTVALTEVPLDAPYDLYHQYAGARYGIDGGKMDGFNLNTPDFPSGKPPSYTPPPYPEYAYAPRTQVQPYFDIASSYVLADRFFPSDADGSFVSHQYLVAGQAGHTYATPAEAPWGCDDPGDTIFLLDAAGNMTQNTTAPCFTYTTLADELDAKNIPWRYYAPASGQDGGYIWSTYDENAQIRNGVDWTTKVVSPESQFLSDVAGGQLATVTWIVPDLANSDHPGVYSSTGPSWVTSIVDAIGTSAFWKSTAVFIMWDDWGGFYDHAPPPQLDYDGLGVRVPLIVVSPYALTGNVAHTQYEFGSVLRFIEQTERLSALTQVDTRARSFGSDVFDFAGPPRKFVPFASPLHAEDFIHERHSGKPPDTDF